MSCPVVTGFGVDGPSMGRVEHRLASLPGNLYSLSLRLSRIFSTIGRRGGSALRRPDTRLMIAGEA